MAPAADTPRIDSFMTADRAESINGKLYIMGGAFDKMAAPAFPHAATFSVAAVLRVPWNDTNRRLPFEIFCENVDGRRGIYELNGELEAGRPPGARGDDLILTLAVPVGFEVQQAERFSVVMRFGGDERRVAVEIVG